GDFGPLFRPDSLVDQGQLHVLQGVQGGDQVVALEDEADLHVADVGELVVVHPAGQLAVEVIAAPGGEIQAAQHVHQGGLARAGGADDGHELPPADGQGDRKSTRLNSSHVSTSYAVFCLKKKTRADVAAVGEEFAQQRG